MRILVIGSKGNMGRRYMAILKYLGHEAIGMDLGDQYPDRHSFDRAIVATTTETHYNICYMMAMLGKDFLCEKPISKDPAMIQKLIEVCADDEEPVDGRMVCNWAFAIDNAGEDGIGGGVRRSGLMPESRAIEYNNYNTGKDGVAWDCIQLIYLAKGCSILKTETPFLDCQIDGVRIDESMIAKSYVTMIDAWLKDPSQLWGLEDAKEATEKVFRHIESNPFSAGGLSGTYTST